MSKYPLESLRDKIFVKHGFPFKSQFFSDSGEYIVLTPGNFLEEGGFKRQVGKEKFYVGAVPEEYLHSKGDLVVAMTEQATGLLGSCAFVPENNVYLHNQRLGLITIKEELIDKGFIYYLFKTSNVRNQIRQSSSGSKVKHTSPERIYDVVAPLPLKEEQKKIAEILSALDKKIELNNKINAELEAMAKLIYDYWFVQFDFPDANGKPYRSSGGKMTYNETLKREIPEGWEVNNLETAAVFKNGKGFKKTQFIQKGKYEVFGSNGVVGRTDSILFKDPVIAIGRVGANYGEVHYSLKPCWISDNAVTAQPACREWYWWLLLTLRRIDYSSISGGSAQPLITQGKLKALECALPNKLLMSAFHGHTNSLFLKIQNLKAQNEHLASLRDWLLPMLMNGQVTIKSPQPNEY